MRKKYKTSRFLPFQKRHNEREKKNRERKQKQFCDIALIELNELRGITKINYNAYRLLRY